LTAAELAEGAAAAVGAAAGRAAVMGQQLRGRQQQQRQSMDFPPVPMTAAQKVLGMQVSLPCLVERQYYRFGPVTASCDGDSRPRMSSLQ
jgi:hypothetical protein